MDSESGPDQSKVSSDAEADQALTFLDQLEHFQLEPLHVELLKANEPEPALSPQQQELWQWLDDAGYRLPVASPDKD